MAATPLAVWNPAPGAVFMAAAAASKTAPMLGDEGVIEKNVIKC